MKKLLTALTLTGCMAGVSGIAQADWVLNAADSDFSFASIKKNHAYETHTFKQYQGAIDDSGLATLTLNLTSVSTGIAIRDQRMQSMLFDTESHPSARYQLQVNARQLESLKAGQRMQLNAEGTLSVLGNDKALAAELSVFKLSDKRVLVSTSQPVVIKAADYGLDKGVEALRKVANLPVISMSVPVSFNLVFDQK